MPIYKRKILYFKVFLKIYDVCDNYFSLETSLFVY